MAPTNASPTKSPKRGRKSKSSASPASSQGTSALLGTSQDVTNNWYRKPKTTRGYKGYVENGKKWLENFTSQDRQDLGDGTSSQDVNLSDLCDAFTKISAATPIALRLFSASKCETEGCGFRTAEGIRSAFKAHFERCVLAVLS